MQSLLKYNKVRGEDNPADGLTKHVKRELIERYLETEGLQIRDDRAYASLKIVGH